MGNNFEHPHIKYDSDIIAESKWNFWNNEKIVVAGMTKRIEASYVKNPLALGVGCYAIFDYSNFNPKFLLALLNSKFFTYYLNIKFQDKHLAGGYLAINKSTIEKLPIIEVSAENQKPIIEMANLMIELNEELYSKKRKFISLINSNFDLDTKSRKLETFYNLTFEDFTREVERLIGDNLSLEQKEEWFDFFEKYKKELLNLIDDIDKTNRKIDDKVYKLFGLSEEEIKTLEEYNTE
jgi:hypothetical protein